MANYRRQIKVRSWDEADEEKRFYPCGGLCTKGESLAAEVPLTNDY